MRGRGTVRIAASTPLRAPALLKSTTTLTFATGDVRAAHAETIAIGATLRLRPNVTGIASSSPSLRRCRERTTSPRLADRAARHRSRSMPSSGARDGESTSHERRRWPSPNRRHRRAGPRSTVCSIRELAVKSTLRAARPTRIRTSTIASCRSGVHAFAIAAAWRREMPPAPNAGARVRQRTRASSSRWRRSRVAMPCGTRQCSRTQEAGRRGATRRAETLRGSRATPPSPRDHTGSLRAARRGPAQTGRTISPALSASTRGSRRWLLLPGCDRPPGWCDAHHRVHCGRQRRNPPRQPGLDVPATSSSRARGRRGSVIYVCATIR